MNDVFLLVTQVQMLRSDHVRSQSLANCNTFHMPYRLKRLVGYGRSYFDFSEGQKNVIFSNINSLYVRTKVNDVFVLVTQVKMLRSDHVRSHSLAFCHIFHLPYRLKRLDEYERS